MPGKVRLPAREAAIRQRLKDDFPHYAEKCLFIRAKSGAIVPFALNPPQRLLHARIEAQRARTGRVRAIVLKARQWGCSTYVEGRFFWRATHSPGMRAFILTHLQAASDNLFDIVARFNRHCPEPVRPVTGTANARALHFDALDTGYRVATAGSRAVGRSETIQLFHGSEVAFWPNAGEHLAGVLQAVPDEPGTEIVLESTANGAGGVFHDLCRRALDGDAAYCLVFLPWFAHPEYRVAPPDGWAAPAAWREYAAAHGLDPAQTWWAYARNRALATACGGAPDAPVWMFRQEYPATIEDAFQAGGRESLVRPDLVAAARRARVSDQSAFPLVLGVDVARGGGDKTRIIDRQGRCAGYGVNRTLDSRDLMVVVGVVAQEIARLRPDHVFIDVTGLGAGVFDRLRELGHRRVSGVNFGARAQNPERYANRRAEMWARMAEWFAAEGGADIPDDAMLQADVCAPAARIDSLSRMIVEAKEEIKARLGRSPDAGDALALTFAQPVKREGYARTPTPARAQTHYDVLAW